MSDVRSLVYAITKFLRSEISEGKLPEEKVEGVEICIQCLEAAYEIGVSEPTLDVSFALQDMFQKYVASENESQREPTGEEQAEADRWKEEGNRQMDAICFEDAVVSYTNAIKLDATNPKYYCNRAAAFNNLEKYEEAIRDCEVALRFDPYYGKAYCRLGTAHSKLHKNWKEAARCYKRAVELEPHNERYAEFLKTAESALAAAEDTRTRSSSSRQVFHSDGSLDSLLGLVSDLVGQTDREDLARFLSRTPLFRSRDPNEPSF